jgi:carbamoyltransferase
MAGGVVLNCVANARVLRDTDYDSIWIPPCASDSGAPFGSALWHYHQTLKRPRTYQLTHAFHGIGYSESEIAEALRRSGVAYKRLTKQELTHQVAKDLAAGRIVGWFEGRSEVGPRALGNRSILADPRDVCIKEKLNSRVKLRAWFRPFAPAILEERVSEFLEIEQAVPFMTMAPRVRAGKASLIPAAVHFDGTARVQTVSPRTNPSLHAIIKRFADLTGVPVLLNTSFNRREPIVQTPDEAISCYLQSQLDVLVVGSFYSCREKQHLLANGAGELQAAE